MIAIDCSKCGKTIQARESAAGKAVRCPACKGSVPVPPAARRKLAIAGVAAAVLAGVVVAGALLPGRSENLWEYGRKRIAAEIQDSEGRGVALAVARALHHRAVDQSVPRDLRGRRGLSMPDPEPYYAALRSLIREELRKMEGGSPFDAATLADFWESKDCGNGTLYVVQLRRDGTFRDAAFDVADSGYRNPTPMDGGTWQFKAGVLTWRGAGGQDDPNPVVRKGALGFVLRETDGSYTYFHRITAPPALARTLQ